ncbi:MAG TPA: cysteine desulfurase family protein [Thermoanaerobaculia bacterium]|jgi:cysteine desulfurase|nr:cysteine desulfurase family protein [Thermoanaerobaculia bacterium]
MDSGSYFDHNATTPLDARVRAAMLPWLGDRHGNPASAHRHGQAAREAVERARDQVAALLGASPDDLVFTASGSEANNAVVFEVARAAGFRGDLVLTAFEHPSVRRTAERCAALGMGVRVVPPGADGVVPAAAMLAAVGAQTRLVCLMLANNELGTLQPVAELAAACRERGVPLLCDAVQAVGKVAVEVGALGADYLTLGGHKFHAPLGSAALWIRPGAPFESHLVGGTQERRRRAGTVNVPAVVGLGVACDLVAAELDARQRHLRALRDRLEAALPALGAIVHGAGAPRLPHTTNVAFPGLVGHDLAIRLDLAGYAVSTGAACHSGVVEPSETLLAMGIPAAEALASLRISFGMTNTLAEVETFLPVLAREVEALRAAANASPLRRAAAAEPAAV